MYKRPNFFLPLAALAALLIVNISGASWQSQTGRADKTARLRERLQAKLNEFHAAGKFPGATAGVALALMLPAAATGFSTPSARHRIWKFRVGLLPVF